jgi:hypothetical protein
MDIIRSVGKKELKLVTALNRLCLRTGLLVCVSLILYFILMQLVGLQRVLVLRGFNMVLLGAGIVWALNRYTRMIRRKLDYFTGLRIGALMSVVATIPFSLFVGIYLTLDTAFMNYLVENMPLGTYLSEWGAAAAVAMEGLSSGFIITFVVMPYFKKQ